MATVVNRATNPSGETATTGYVAVPGTTGVCAVTNPTVTTAFGVKVVRFTWSTASTVAGGGGYVDVTVVAGEILSAGFGHVRASIGNRLQLSIEWRTNVGTISTVSAAAVQVVAAAVGTSAVWKLENQTAPALATIARIKVLSVAGTGYANWSIASYLELDGLMVTAGATLQSYVDGSLGSMYGWNGAAHASTSTFYTPVVSLETIVPELPYTSSTLAPRIIVTVDDLPPAVAELTFYRASDRRTFKGRGSVLIEVAGGFSFVDFEAPFGVASAYRALMYDGAGVEIGYTSTATATLDVNESWIHNPLYPAGAAQIDVDQTSARRLARRSDGAVEHSDNRVLGVLISGLRRGLQGVDLFLSTQSLETANRFQDMLGGYDETDQTVPVLCIRTPPYDRLPRTFFAAVLELAEKPVNVHMGGELIEYEATGLDEVAPPFPGLVVPLLTRDDVDAFYASRNALDAAYLRRLDIDRDYSKAGTA